ncbi:hypothetical protein BGZ94_006755, partial [Podila epigama]
SSRLPCTPARRVILPSCSRTATPIVARPPRHPSEPKLSLKLWPTTNVLTAAPVSTPVLFVVRPSHPSASSRPRLFTSARAPMAHPLLLRIARRVDALLLMVMISATPRATAPALEVELHLCAVSSFPIPARLIPTPSTSAVA